MEKTLGNKIEKFFGEYYSTLNPVSFVGEAFDIFSDYLDDDEIVWVFSELLTLDSVNKIKYFLESTDIMTLNKTLLLIEYIVVYFENSFEELVLKLIISNPNGFGIEIMNQNMLSDKSRKKVLDGLESGVISVQNICLGRNG